MNKLSFKILPTDQSQDHEVRILIDNSDFLGKEHLGIDPPEFFGQHSFLTEGQLLVGRCSCGVIGCDDYAVYVSISEDKITWTDDRGLNLEFDKSVYIEAISSARLDYSWESKERRVERLTSAVLKNTRTSDDYKFDWTSARIKQNTITVSYSKERQQKIFEFYWDGQTNQSAVSGASCFLEQRQVINAL